MIVDEFQAHSDKYFHVIQKMSKKGENEQCISDKSYPA